MNKELIRKLLNALPKTARGIAEYFVEQGIDGAIGEPQNCPVANYFTQNGVDKCQVFTNEIYFYCKHTSGEPMEFTLAIKERNGIRLFLELFDNGSWPELIDTEFEEGE